MAGPSHRDVTEREVGVPLGLIALQGTLDVPRDSEGIVLFAHGSGSSRHSPRNRYVAGVLREAGLATLLMDLLTIDEEAVDARTAHLRFDIDLLAERLVGATDWLAQNPDTRALRLGYFGASTGAAAALVAAAERPDAVELNRRALAALRAEARLEIVPGASHLFEEPGTLERVAALARQWFEARLAPRHAERS
jgi:putative phosphoribosyl transferase